MFWPTHSDDKTRINYSSVALSSALQSSVVHGRSRNTDTPQPLYFGFKVEGLRNVEASPMATRATTSEGIHEDAALAPGSNEPGAIENEIQDSRKGEEIKTAHIPKPEITSQQYSPSEPSLQDPKPGNPISHLQIVALSQQLKSINAIPCRLDALLRGSHVYIPPPPPKPTQTPEYKALMARLRHDAEEREYVRLTKAAPVSEAYSKNLPATSPAFAFASTEAYIEASPDDDITYDDINRQLTLILNVVVSIIACSAALWMVSKWWSTPARLALSFAGSILVAAAEVGVYFGYIRKVKESVQEERAVKEVRELVDTWVANPSDNNISKEKDVEEATLLKGKDNETIRRRTKNNKKDQS
ncbi:hypothetical protein V493_03451 [Pseudogymnoascus sp. VKM F-4281 (FW-2241)]|nr:hypothetical protein V493_03451 [Pseudogymnoascus sp. VKM F-4281 (FW-2241)]